MYPEITPLVRDTIKRRYELIPYNYSLALESHTTATPPIRWVGWGYESDAEVWKHSLIQGDSQFWFGDSLIVGCVGGPGINSVKVYLPKQGSDRDDGFINLNAPYQHLAAGQWAEIACPWKQSIPVLAKIGGAVPVGKNRPTYAPGGHDYESPYLSPDDYRAVEIFPPQGSSDGKTYESTWYEDDGDSANPKISSFTISYSSNDSEVVVKFKAGSNNLYIPLWKDIHVVLPVGDHRSVTLNGNPVTSSREEDGGRRLF